MNHALDLIDGIVRDIPVLKLGCKPDTEAVALLKQELNKL
jgi:hypothetical protein